MADRIAAYSCYRCSEEFPITLTIDSNGCPSCSKSAPSNLRLVYPTLSAAEMPAASRVMLPSMWRYGNRLPFDAENAISLGEGLTPLLHAEHLGLAIDVADLFIKNEGYNPTWSHKDRFSTVAVTAAVHMGARVVATSSSGNAGASLAAYAARAGLECIVAAIAGSAGPMLSQIQKYGASLIAFEDKRDRWTFLEKGTERFGWYTTSPYRHPVVGSHPVGIEGYKTIAYEIIEQMNGKAPDWCALPVCYGDVLVGVWLGFSELLGSGHITHMPRLLAAEAHGSLATALKQGTDNIPDMAATFETLAVSVGATRSTFQALKALRESNGIAMKITNKGLICLQEKIAAMEGMFLELSSAMPIAAIAAARQQKIITRGETVVAVVTASGLKDMDRTTSTHRTTPFSNVVSALNYFANRGST